MKEKSLLAIYAELARAERNVTFIGRLGTYRYLDMHVTIAEALDAVDIFAENQRNNVATPAFLVDPVSGT